MPLITDTEELEAFCLRLSQDSYITVDTEFMREKTFWPILCLVQVAGAREGRVIDAMAEGMDLTSLFKLMADPSKLKVFHAARQDLEIFHKLTGRLPEPVFDTQVAAMVCGFGDSVGYEALISKLTKNRVDKSSRFTDWALRPLSERQISYALADVTYLREAYEKLQDMLDANGRAGWLEEEMAVLMSNGTYDPDPREAFRRIKAGNANARCLAVLREVAAWREEEARRRDQPRNRILRDEALMEISHHTPSTPADLARTRGLGRRLAEGPAGEAILKAVKRGLDTPKEERPQPKVRRELPRGIGPVSDLLKVLLKMKCEESGVAQKLLASVADVEMIAAFGADADVKALHGWRREVFGADALKLRNGETALAVGGKKLILVDGSQTLAS